MRILFLLSVLFCACSENLNPLECADNRHINGINTNAPVNLNRFLIWQHPGLFVTASGERIVNRDEFCSLQFDGRNNLLITFDGWTNSDTTQYVSQVSVESDERTILNVSGELHINRHHELCIVDLHSRLIRFYIALWCDEIECSSTAKLEISNIKIYTY